MSNQERSTAAVRAHKLTSTPKQAQKSPVDVSTDKPQDTPKLSPVAVILDALRVGEEAIRELQGIAHYPEAANKAYYALGSLHGAIITMEKNAQSFAAVPDLVRALAFPDLLMEVALNPEHPLAKEPIPMDLMRVEHRGLLQALAKAGSNFAVRRLEKLYSDKAAPDTDKTVPHAGKHETEEDCSKCPAYPLCHGVLKKLEKELGEEKREAKKQE